MRGWPGTPLTPMAVALIATLACGGKPPPAYDVPPILVNREEITAAMGAVGAGLEARVVLLVRVDERGYARDVRIAESSGSADLDDSAVWIGEQMRFEPACYQGEAVPALVRVPVSFDVVTRIVRPPKLRNADLVAEIMAHEHSEVVGAAYFRILVGPEGWVRSVKDRRASEPEPRRVARQLIDQLRFWPAYRGSKPVGRWVNLTFQFDGPRSRVSMESPDR